VNQRDVAAAVEDEFNERYQYRPPPNAWGTYTPVNETMRCRDCNVSWNGDDPCWCCGRECKPAGHVIIDTGMVVNWQWGLPEEFDTPVNLFD
jgi:hypothetical protein